MHIRKKMALLLALGLMLATVAPAAAQEGGEGEVPPCEGESVSGTVVAVDEETGMVTVQTEDGQCTVMLNGEYDHPIVALLGTYFGDVDASSLAAALETVQGCAVYDEDTEEWTWADCDAEDAVPATVVEVLANEDGTFTATLEIEGEEEPAPVPVEEDAAAELTEALEALAVDWEVDEEGAVVQPGDEIADYHEDGLGFGVLVKVYVMAAESQEACEGEDAGCAMTVAELVEAFQSGMGLGQLFKGYGKPSMLGVGHIRQAMAGEAPAEGSDQAGGGGTRGICNARSRGGNAHAKGHGNVDCP